MTINKRSKYYYKGPVKEFDTTRTNNWEGVTWAVSEAKALANLSYRYKQEKGLLPGTKISLNSNYLIELSALNDYIYYDTEMRRMINEQEFCYTGQ